MNQSSPNATTPLAPPVRLVFILLHFIDDYSFVSSVGFLFCLIVSILIPCRLFGRAHFKKKVNVLLMLSCWIDALGCGCQVLADYTDPEFETVVNIQISRIFDTEYFSVCLQNVAMVLLFVSRKMAVVIAVYWKTYSTSLIPEHESNRKWWYLHLLINIPYCLLQGFINLTAIFESLHVGSDNLRSLQTVSMIMGIGGQTTAILTVTYCLIKVGRKMCTDISPTVRGHYWRIAIGLALKTIALLIPIVESASLTRDMFFAGPIDYKDLKKGEDSAVVQVVIHLLRELYPTMDTLITMGMLWRICFPKNTQSVVLVESAAASTAAKNR